MKHLIILICTGVALASAALAQTKQDDNNTSTTTIHRGSGGNSKAQVAPVRTRQVTRTSAIRAQRSVSTAPMRTHTHRTTPRFNGNTTNARLRERHANATVRSENTTNIHLRERTVRQNDRARVQGNVAVNPGRNFRNRTVSGNTTRNVGVNRNRNVTVTNNWRGSRFSGQQYAAFEITTGNGMIGVGGPATTTASSLLAEAGISGTGVTGIRRGVTTDTLTIRTTVRSMVTAI